jgi:hypothetical protein
MKRNTLLLALALCFFGLATCFAEDPSIGTWKLNAAKSNVPAGAMKNSTVVYVQQGDKIKCVTDGVVGTDTPLHIEWTGKFDGNDYPLIGDSESDTRSYKKIDDHTLELINKKNGQVTVRARVVYARNFKTRTMTTVAIGDDGKKIITHAVYDKE